MSGRLTCACDDGACNSLRALLFPAFNALLVWQRVAQSHAVSVRSSSTCARPSAGLRAAISMPLHAPTDLIQALKSSLTSAPPSPFAVATAPPPLPPPPCPLPCPSHVYLSPTSLCVCLLPTAPYVAAEARRGCNVSPGPSPCIRRNRLEGGLVRASHDALARHVGSPLTCPPPWPN